MKSLTSDRKLFPNMQAYTPEPRLPKMQPSSLVTENDVALQANDNNTTRSSNNLLKFIKNIFRKPYQPNVVETSNSSDATIDDSSGFSSDLEEDLDPSPANQTLNTFSEIVFIDPKEDIIQDKQVGDDDINEQRQSPERHHAQSPTKNEEIHGRCGKIDDTNVVEKQFLRDTLTSSADKVPLNAETAENMPAITTIATVHYVDESPPSGAERDRTNQKEKDAVSCNETAFTALPLTKAPQTIISVNDNLRSEKSFKIKEMALKRYSTHFSQSSSKALEENSQSYRKMKLPRKNRESQHKEQTSYISKTGKDLQKKLHLADDEGNSRMFKQHMLPRIHDKPSYQQRAIRTQGVAEHRNGIPPLIHVSTNARLPATIKTTRLFKKLSFFSDNEIATSHQNLFESDPISILEKTSTSRTANNELSGLFPAFAEPSSGSVETEFFREHLQKRRNKVLASTVHGHSPLVRSIVT